MGKWEEDFEWSARAFKQMIWPEIKEHLGGGELMSVEQIQDSPFARLFDILAGFDAVQTTPDGRVRGISSRIQRRPDHAVIRSEDKYWHPYNTFTLRKSRESGAETEIEKRIRAINGESLYPAITVQSYLETKEGPWLTIGVIETRLLFDFIADSANARNLRIEQVTRDGAARFVVVPWWALGSDRMKVFRNPEIYPPKIEITRDPVLNQQQLSLF
jgi:hypothetical protein